MKSLFRIGIVVLAIIGAAFVYKGMMDGLSTKEILEEVNLDKAANTAKSIAKDVYDVVKKDIKDYTKDDVKILEEERKKYKKGTEEYEKLTEKIKEAKEYLKNKEN